MNVEYRDRRGKVWRFDVAATPYQALLFRRVLYAVRNVAQRENLSLTYLADADNNDAFLSNVEAVVLAALSDRYAPPAPPPQPARAVEAEDEPPERKPYYWELF